MFFLRYKVVIAVSALGFALSIALLSLLAAQLVDTEAALNPLRQYVKELTGQPLITEKISIHILTGPRLEINGVAIRNLIETREPYLIYAKKMEISIPWAQLFSEAPKVDALSLSGVRLYLENGEKGQRNWAFFSEMKEQVSALESLDIHIHQGSVRYADRLNQRTLDIERLAGSLFIAGQNIRANLSASLMQQPVRLSGECEVSMFDHVNHFDTNCKGTLDGEGLELDVQNRMLMSEAGLQSRGSLSIETSDIRLWGDAFFSQQQKAMQSYVTEPLAFSANLDTYSDTNQMILNVNQFRMGNSEGKGSYSVKEHEGQPKVNVKALFQRLDFDEMKELVRQSAGTKEELFVFHDGFDARRQGNLSVEADTVLYNGLTIKDLRVRGGFGAGEIVIEQARGFLPGQGGFTSLGRLIGTPQGLQYEGLIEASGKELHRLASLIDLQSNDPIRQTLTNYRARFNVSLNPVSTIISELRLITGKRIRIAGGLNLSQVEEGQITGTLRVENLDLTPFQQAWLKNASLYKTPDTVTDSPFAFRWLPDVSRQTNLTLHLKDYQWMDFQGKAALLKLAVKSGYLGLERLELDLNETRISGKVSIEHTAKQARPFVSSRLIISRANVGNAIRASLWENKEAPKVISDQSVWNKTPFNFNPLKHVDGRFEWRVKRLLHEAFTANNVSAITSLDDGVLSISDWRMNLWEGQFSGDIVLDTRTLPEFQAKWKLENANLGTLLEHWVEYDNLNGLVAISSTMKSSGVDFSTWIKNLDGALSFEARNVIARYFNLPAIVRAVSSVRSVSGLANAIRLAFDSGSTRFNSITGVTYFEDGALNITKVNMRSNESVGELEGRWNLQQWTLNMTLRLGLVSLAQANYPNLVMNFAGALELPQRQLDLKSIEAFLAQKLR